ERHRVIVKRSYNDTSDGAGLGRLTLLIKDFDKNGFCIDMKVSTPGTLASEQACFLRAILVYRPYPKRFFASIANIIGQDSPNRVHSFNLQIKTTRGYLLRQLKQNEGMRRQIIWTTGKKPFDLHICVGRQINQIVQAGASYTPAFFHLPVWRAGISSCPCDK